MRSGLLYDRRASLLIAPVSGQAGLDLTDLPGKPGLRIGFEVHKTSTSHANTATIKVWNLTETSRNRVAKKKTALILRAGYGDAQPLPLLASGVVQRVEHTPQPPDVLTEVEIRDGGTGLDESKTKRVYPKGTPLRRIVEDILGEMNDVAKGSLIASALAETLPAKRCFSGSSRVALDRLATSFGFEWSVQDGVAQFLDRTGSSKPQVTAILLSKDSGMIGSPTKTNAGCKVKSLLMPEILPGVYIQTDGQFCRGYFKAVTVDHKGDNYGEEWESETEAKSIDKWDGVGSKSKGKK